MADTSVFDAAGGAAGLRRISSAWHARAVADPAVGHAFEHGFRDDHEERLAAYLGEALGGPADYTARYGDETAVVVMHSGNGEHPEMDAAAIACFDAALDDAGLTGDVRRVLSEYWAWATRTTMAAYPDSPGDVPAGLAIPRWSWDGLVVR